MEIAGVVVLLPMLVALAWGPAAGTGHPGKPHDGDGRRAAAGGAHRRRST